MSAPSPADRRAGPYVLERRLGSGAMGEVWLARHADSRATAAVKVLRKSAATRQRVRQFFDRERRIVARLGHPHIAALFDVGADYIATAYIDGADLARRLHTPVDAIQARQWFLQIASALSHAHARSVVHRDVKPSNILLDRRGNAYLADFGLARVVGEDDALDSAAGTPAYMAPEQCDGRPVTPAADQYALARTLIEMLSGGALPLAHDAAIASLPDSLPDGLRDALVRATHTDPSQRWPTVDAFAAAVARAPLDGYDAPTRLAPEVRMRAPFGWTARPRGGHAVAHAIARADYQLADLEAAGALPPAACAAFRRDTGYADFGFSLYGNVARIGALTDPAALARATELVVLMHGFMGNRTVWRHVAAAICRDNAQAIALVPDLNGFGTSPFEGAPAAHHLTAPALTHAVVRWLELLGVRDLPTVLVGHSMSATHLLAASDDQLGTRTARVAMNPVFPAVDPAYRRRVEALLIATRVVGTVRPLARHLVARGIRRDGRAKDLADAEHDLMVGEFAHMSLPLLAAITRGVLRATVPPGDHLHNCVILLGNSDPIATDAVVGRAMRTFGIPAANVMRMATGGHYPHLESASHPEHTARNLAHIVEIIDAMLIATRNGTLLATQLQSTALSDPAETSDDYQSGAST